MQATKYITKPYLYLLAVVLMSNKKIVDETFIEDIVMAMAKHSAAWYIFRDKPVFLKFH